MLTVILLTSIMAYDSISTVEDNSMFSRDQLKTFLLIRKRQGTFLFNTRLPKPLIHIISTINYKPNSEIAQLLHSVAHGDFKSVKCILEINPRLLLEAGDVTDPAGNIIKRVTPYECALSVGDPGMANAIHEFFSKIEGLDGGKEQVRQYASYQHSINHMSNQQADFDFNRLFQIIKDSSSQDIEEELKIHNFDPDYQGTIPKKDKITLRQALEMFRKHFDSREILNGVHFNYANLLEAMRILKFECQYGGVWWGSDKDRYKKCDLFWRQVIGYIQRALPACDRQALAQDFTKIAHDEKELEPSFKFNHDNYALHFYGISSYPVTAGDQSRQGLGYEFAIWGDNPRGDVVPHSYCVTNGFDQLQNYLKNKYFKLAHPMQLHQSNSTSINTYKKS